MKRKTDRRSGFSSGRIISWIAIFCILAALSIGLCIFFAQEPQDEDVRIEEHEHEREISYKELQKDLDSLRKDRDNLLVQVKRLTQKSGEVKVIEGDFNKLIEERDILLDKKEKLEKKEKVLKNEIEKRKKEIERFKTLEKKLNEEKSHLEELVVALQSRRGIVRLKSAGDSLKKEKLQLARSLKETQKKLGQLEKKSRGVERELEINKYKFERDIKEYKSRLDRLKDLYAETLQEKKILADKLAKLPGKFAELARQNKKLIKETTNMHYNLGVFYTKNKEYKRAAAEFKETLKLKPDHAYASYNLGYIYAEYQVDRPQAVRYFKDYLEFSAGKEDKKDKKGKNRDWVRKYILTWETWYGREIK